MTKVEVRRLGEELAIVLPTEAGHQLGIREGASMILRQASDGCLLSKAPDQTDMQHLLRGVWASVLNVPPQQISFDDDFFRIGGCSLQSIQVASRIQAALATPVPIDLIFDFPTIRTLAAKLAEQSGADASITVEL